MRSLFALPLLAWRAVRWRAYRGGWLWSHLRTHRPFDPGQVPQGTTIHVVVTVVDHFEPARKSGDDAAAASVESWVERYRDLAAPRRDADGRWPQHTWFYRSEYRNDRCLATLGEAAFEGLGEVEFHLHHGHDTHETFSARLREGLDWFGRWGAMITAERSPRRRFAYIAGNWALDNGAGDDAVSGCNTELLALKEAGCYADFTFPALGSRAQPRITNAIYHATDDPGPKSYDDGQPAEVGRPAAGDLTLFQGPLWVDRREGRFHDGALESGNPPSPRRLRPWLAANVHVRGRTDWIFVKLHTHGMQSRDAMLSPAMASTWDAMIEEWNRPPFRLHFATAREAYNIARAAEQGLGGDPAEHRDHEVPPPAGRKVWCSVPWRPVSIEEGAVAIELHDDAPCTVRLVDGPVRRIEGRLRRVALGWEGSALRELAIDGTGTVRLSGEDGVVFDGPVTPGMERALACFDERGRTELREEPE